MQVVEAATFIERENRLFRFSTPLCTIVTTWRVAVTTEQLKQEVENELTGRETEPWEIIYFKLYKSQLPVVEQAIETAALMLGTGRSRGYSMEMICADFLAGANLENENPEILLQSPYGSSSSSPAKRDGRFCTT